MHARRTGNQYLQHGDCGAVVERSKNKNQKRKDALRRLTMRNRNDYLRKVGLLDETEYEPKRKT